MTRTALWTDADYRCAGCLSIVYGIWAITVGDAGAMPATPAMQEIAAAIAEGAQAYLKRQYTTIAIVGVVIFVISPSCSASAVAIGFAIGAILSGRRASSA